jgi:hypothetical protein
MGVHQRSLASAVGQFVLSTTLWSRAKDVATSWPDDRMTSGSRLVQQKLTAHGTCIGGAFGAVISQTPTRPRAYRDNMTLRRFLVEIRRLSGRHASSAKLSSAAVQPIRDVGGLETPVLTLSSCVCARHRPSPATAEFALCRDIVLASSS